MSSKIVDKYHDFLDDQLKEWTNHAKQSRSTYNKVLGNVGNKNYTFREMTGDVMSLWLSCYDTAYGWMLPQKR
jgi:hypothetical protein